jgi:uncharacterized membrane protein
MDLLHPKLVHLPIALAVLMPLISSGVLLAWWRGWFPKAVWALVVALQLILVGSSFAAMNTGEEDEERVEEVVPEDAIEAHEEAAELFTWSAVALLVLMIAGGAIPRERASQAVALASALGTLGILGLGFEVGARGGEIVYEHDSPSAFKKAASPLPEGGAPNQARDDEDDDD